jgi:L-amino acid N-acyltransferase YncA
MLALHKEQIPLDIHWLGYQTNARAGRLHLLTARTEDRKLAGYYVSYIVRHEHYHSTLFGMVDAYYIAPEHRTPTTGIELFMALDQEMRKCGVKCLISTTKLHYDLTPLLERCGWQAAGKTFTKVLV